MTQSNVTPLRQARVSVPPAYPDLEIGVHLRRAAMLIVILIGGFGGWGAIASINGAVVAPATVGAKTRTNVVQHADGGVVTEIFVKEGDQVSEGQILLRLDGKDVDEELQGVEAELAAKMRQLELINGELAGLNDLAERGLVPRTRVLAMQREMAGLNGDIGQLGAKKAHAVERGKRLAVKAPIKGRILNLALHTIGGVIAPGKELMQIVPSGDALVVEAKLAPKDIDQVHPGQAVAIRLSALNQRTTPQLWGTVSVVSPDLVRDEATSAHYYAARIAFGDGELDRLGAVQLVPGMPAEVLIQTASRSALSYFVKPMLDQITRAFRET